MVRRADQIRSGNALRLVHLRSAEDRQAAREAAAKAALGHGPGIDGDDGHRARGARGRAGSRWAVKTVEHEG